MEKNNYYRSEQYLNLFHKHTLFRQIKSQDNISINGFILLILTLSCIYHHYNIRSGISVKQQQQQQQKSDLKEQYVQYSPISNTI